jgi:hypothetical protein
MPVKPSAFVPPHKPVTRIADLLAKHNGQQNWSEVVVRDNLFLGTYISMAPGAKTPRRLHQHRIWWVVQDGTRPLDPLSDSGPCYHAAQGRCSGLSSGTSV